MKSNTQPRIFIVEDNPMYNELVHSFLQRAGYTNLHSFTGGGQCLEQLYTMPDIVFLDYGLGDMNGFEVLKQIKAFDPDIQVVFLSGQEDMDAALSTLKYGAFDYVVKNDQAFQRITDIMQRLLQVRGLLRKQYRFNRLAKSVLVAALLMATVVLGCISLI